MGVRPRWRPRIPRRAQGGAAEGGHYAGCKSAAYLSQPARPLDSNRLYATLPNRYSTTIQTQPQKRRARQMCRAWRGRDARFLSDKLRSRSRTSIGRTHIRNPLARFPTNGFRPHSEDRRRFNHFPTPIWTESTATQPRSNHPSCRIREPHDSDTAILNP